MVRFFFKQKTAYDMRISDWSSDVCSSDLNRPVVSTGLDGHRSLTWPGTQIAIASPPDLDRDVILVRGLEPNMRWRQFCAEILAACDDLGGELVITLGALLSDTPHTRPIPVTGTATEPDLVDRSEEHTSELQSLLRLSSAVS